MTLRPFITYEEPSMAIVSITGKVTIESAIVCYPADMGGHQNMVRYTLFPCDLPGVMTRLELTRSSVSDEGRSRESIVIEQDFNHDDMPIWQIETTSIASDCDGKVRTDTDFKSYGGVEAGAPNWAPDRSPLQRTHGEIQDIHAQAMGY